MKKILLSILISFIWLVWFWYCWFENNFTTWFVLTTSQNWNNFFAYDSSWIKIVPINWSITVNWETCLFVRSTWTNPNSYLQASCWWSNYNEKITSFTFSAWSYWFECYDTTHNCTSTSIDFWWQTFSFTNVSWWSDCPSQYTSEECQQEYSLMPISSCDSEYCQLNELCWTWSSWSWDLQWSSLFINWIQHVWWSIIDVTIPSEIQRNYIYTWENEETFKLDIEGLNGDPDYIQWIIDVNSYRPTSEDFTNTFVWGLTLIFPYIIITAIVLFIWRFIRKIFK